MSDCANVEIRELLPEYLHARLSASDRARVDGHLADCEDCTTELATLQLVRRAFGHEPSIDTAAIVRLLPRPPAMRPSVRSAPRFVAWRIAAAISFISLCGISVAVARSYFTGEAPSAQVDTARASQPVPSPLAVVAPQPGAAASVGATITFAGGVSDLATEDLEKLLTSIESLEAAPPVDPDATSQSEIGRVRSDTSGEL